MRAFVEAEIMPFTHEWDESKSLPLELYKKTYEAGILPGVVGAPWAGGMGDRLAVKGPANFDYFHELIILDEFGRCGSGGVLWGLLEGVHIGLPPVLNFGNRDLRERVGLRVLKGEGTICLCITVRTCRASSPSSFFSFFFHFFPRSSASLLSHFPSFPAIFSRRIPLHDDDELKRTLHFKSRLSL